MSKAPRPMGVGAVDALVERALWRTGLRACSYRTPKRHSLNSIATQLKFAFS
ncbi:MAG: hypothetical protein ACK5AP_01885 [Burkholderiales bacterium]|nr:hypothetical protein [Limnohabitans sp.]